MDRTVLQFTPGQQPALPDDVDWHPMTVKWWAMWSRHPIAQELSEGDWSFLLETAWLNHRYWNGDFKQAAELRLRTAKFGITPEDRARLRIVFADADEKETKRSTSGTPSVKSESSPYTGLRAMRERNPAS